ncbi:CesT family type III secretion system chaperone [Aquibium microcysteis]|uniref:CesT family type III secretion system chaperone n=1 Tax=Aquibium microcysteis TaxID=675281 RepID=UPI00165CF71B|nr:CesT family type III secretion system chaperone [Aquibium microcysteis]
MADLHQRFRGSDTILADYGLSIGLPDLAFDSDGEVVIEMGDVPVCLVAGDQEAGYVVKAHVNVPDGVPQETFAGYAAMRNGVMMGHGMGIVALDGADGGWVWTDRIEPAQLTPERLHERLLRATRNVAYWQAAIDLLAPAAEEAPAVGDPSLIIRA